MTPISAIASLPLASPESDPGAGRANRRAAPMPDVTPSDGESPATNDKASAERSFWDRLWGKEGFSFGAVLDIINPLQHIPIVSTIYRAATGDTIGAGPRMVGGALFGGVIGLIAAAADAAVEGVTGKDAGSHVLAMLPEPDPVPQWALEDLPRNRTVRMAMLKSFEGGSPQAAPPPATEIAAADSASAPGDGVEPPAAPLAEAAKQAPSPLRVSEPVSDPRPNRLFTPQPRTAQSGAGGQMVPLASHGRPVVKLPTPQELAANPALLQEMRQGGAAAINASQKNSGRIDTAIKGHGLIAPGPAAPNHPAGAAAWYDRQAREAEAKRADGESAAKGQAETGTTSSRESNGPPEVGPDFLMKMQQALEKYQAMRPAPTVDVTH